jgi:hypothetical protein
MKPVYPTALILAHPACVACGKAMRLMRREPHPTDTDAKDVGPAD